MDIKRRVEDKDTKHNAIALNYDFVMSLSPNDGCYILNEREIVTLLSILDYQRWVTRWYSDETEITAPVVGRFVDGLMKKLLSPFDCGGGGEPVTASCKHYVGEVFFSLVELADENILDITLGGTWNKIDYPDLWAGLPSGMKNDTTFTIPDMRLRGLVGYYVQFGETPVVVGETGGEREHTLTTSEMPAHAHDFKMSSGATAGSLPIQYSTPRTTVAGTYTTENEGGGLAHNNMSPFLAGYWYIQASNCDTGSQDDFAIRLTDCALQYSFNGVDWLEVDGWSSIEGCIDVPLPFDLRFYNCVLEYSRDSAQTWDDVPGWSDAAACIDTDTPYDLKLEDGILQYSKDGGQDWATVPGWTEQIAEIVNEPARCQNAWGLTYVFCDAAAQLVYPLTDDPTLQEYTVSAEYIWSQLVEWLFFGYEDRATEPSAEFQEFVVWCFNVPQRTEFIPKFEDLLKQEIIARYFYTASPNGEWCTENITELLNWLYCTNVTEDHVIAIILLFKAVRAAYENMTGDDNALRAFLYRSRDYGTCQSCAGMMEVDLCLITWQKSLVGEDLISSDGFTLSYGQDTSEGARSTYGAGNNAHVAIVTNFDSPSDNASVTFNISYVNIANPTWTLQCVLNGSIPILLASGNTAPAAITASLPDGAITGLMLSMTGLGDYPGTITINSAYLEGSGECPFLACD